MRNVAPITALITVYNGESYIAEAIKSVHAQTLPVAEILVIDDGSTDQSSRIALELGARVIRQENGGAGAARNLGFISASQEWIAMLDYDDIWEPEKIELQWKALNLCEKAGLIFTDFCQVDNDSKRQLVPSVFNLPEAGFDHLRREFFAHRISFVEKVDKSFLSVIQKNVFFPSAVLVNRAIAIEAGLFDAAIFPLDDIDFFLRCFTLTSIAFVETPLMRYRMHSQNTTKNELKMFLAFFSFVQHMLKRRDRYPEGAVEIFTAPDSLARKQLEAGRLMIDVGRFVEARELLAESFRLRKSSRAALLWLVSWLGNASLKRLFRVKRSLTLVSN